jgi:hypothetical protein
MHKEVKDVDRLDNLPSKEALRQGAERSMKLPSVPKSIKTRRRRKAGFKSGSCEGFFEVGRLLRAWCSAAQQKQLMGKPVVFP